MAFLPFITGMSSQVAQGGQKAQGGFGFFLPLIVIFGIFYFMLIRPQQKKQKEHQKLLDSVKKGDKVVTIGGMIGIVSSVKDNVITVKVADNVKIDFTKSAIAQVTSGEGSAETEEKNA